MLDWPNREPASLPPGHPPVMCVIVDTEEEFDWSKPFSRQCTATTSIGAQEAVHHSVYDRLGIVPTYVVDWPVATTPKAYSALRAIMREGRCDVGTHLHPWVSPPYVEVVNAHNSYAGNLAPELEAEKIKQLTNAIHDNFGHQPQVFKAGRYGLGPHTLAILEALGYLVDASVVPHTAFIADGGPDYTNCTNAAFWFADPRAPMLALPVTTAFCGALKGVGPELYPKLDHGFAASWRVKGLLARTHLLERIRLTPEGCDLGALKRLMMSMKNSGQPMTLTYHSPSLVPGNTPYVRTANELSGFLNTIEQCCQFFKEELGGVFLTATQIHKLLLKSK